MDKRCSKCGQDKDIDLFYNEKAKPDGKAVNCKVCVEAYKKQYAKEGRSRKSQKHNNVHPAKKKVLKNPFNKSRKELKRLKDIRDKNKPRRKPNKHQRLLINNRMAATVKHNLKQKIKKEVSAGTYKYETVLVRKKPKKRPKSVVEYDFLQYVTLAFKWVRDNYPELKRNQIEMLLYLHPKGAFTLRQFHFYHRVQGLYTQWALKRLIKSGYIIVWREGSNRGPKLYGLSHKAKTICTRLHTISCGDTTMSESTKRNKVLKQKSVHKNKYYTQIIKQMNKERAQKKET